MHDLLSGKIHRFSVAWSIKMYRLRLFAAVWLVCSHVGQSEAAVETMARNMTGYDVHDIIGQRCCSADECYPSQSDVGALNDKLAGRAVLPHMHEFIKQSHMYNTVEQRYPRIVVMAHTKEDIKETVLFARKFNLHVTVRSSGHDYVGRSTWDGSININLSEMKKYEVRLDSVRSEHGEIQVQTGLTWAEIYKMLDKDYQRTIVGGSAHTVTPGGYTLGGGHSPISRSLGYAVDNVIEIQVVLADGRIATCTESETVIEDVDGSIRRRDDGALFWAMRGGGGGTFGVVVYIVFRLHPMPVGMVRADTWFPMKIDSFQVDISTQVLTALGNLIQSLPREWGGYFIMGNTKTTFAGIAMTGYLQLVMNKFGPWDGSEENSFKEFINLGKQYQINVTFTNRSSFWDYEKDVSDPPITRAYIVNTMLQQKKLDERFAQFIQEEFFTNFKDAYLGCTGALVGGRTTEFPIESTPLNSGYRTAISSFTCGLGLGDPLNNQPWFEQSRYDDIMIPHADALSERLRRFGKGMYLNEPTKNNPHWKEDFWGDDNYEKLLKIKRKYDPENFFTCHHCVGSDIKGKSTTPWTSGTAMNRIYSPLIILVLFLKLISV